MASPMPAPPPVTTATLFFRSIYPQLNSVDWCISLALGHPTDQSVRSTDKPHSHYQSRPVSSIAKQFIFDTTLSELYGPRTLGAGEASRYSCLEIFRKACGKKVFPAHPGWQQ